MPPMAMPPMAMPPMGGMMPMSFYARYRNVTLLFASWMPTSKAGFVLSCIAICAAASCEVMLRKIAVRVERRLMRSRQPVLRRNAQRAVLTFFSRSARATARPRPRARLARAPLPRSRRRRLRERDGARGRNDELPFFYIC